MRQINRRRPNFKTAHDFHKLGVFMTGPEHYVSNAEQQYFCDSLADTLHTLIKKHFPKSHNLEYVILKSHLIIEFSITQYIRGISRILVDDASMRRFSFLQKLEVAYLMGFGANDPIVIPTIERLNQIRNQVAHSFSIDRAMLDEMIRINSEEYAEFPEFSDRIRIRHLRWLCIMVAGRAAGELSVHHYLATRAENSLSAEIQS